MTEILIPQGLRLVNLSTGSTAYRLAFSEQNSAYENWISHLGGPDENARLLIRLMEGRGTLLDVGAHIGTVSVPVATTGPKVIAVEMIPANCMKLWTAVIANGLTDFRIVQAAASDNNGLISYSGADVSGSVDPHGSGAKAVCLTLDSILQSMPPPTPPLLVKLDVEGHESAVLRGASDTINAYRPIILFEAIEIEGASASAARATKLVLEQYGYKLYLVSRGVLVPRTSKDAQEGHVTDFLAVPPEKSGILSDLNLTVRPLSDAERLAWITEMAENQAINHRRHAAGLLIRFATEEPTFVKLTAAVLARLTADDELGPEMLRSLRAIRI